MKPIQQLNGYSRLKARLKAIDSMIRFNSIKGLIPPHPDLYREAVKEVIRDQTFY